MMEHVTMVEKEEAILQVLTDFWQSTWVSNGHRPY